MDKRVVFKPEKATCGKCGGPIGFYKITTGKAKGKWCPCNPDGSDHWDSCRENQQKGTYGIQKDLPNSKPGVLTYHQNKPIRARMKKLGIDFYSGDVPPWDESLGGFKWSRQTKNSG